jgi:hypothetical protein
VRRYELRVQQCVTAIDQSRDEVDEGNLAGIPLAAEHALAKERSAERYAV